MTPAQRNRYSAFNTYPGRVLIATCANREYLSYADLFKYCMRKAYPEYDVAVSAVPDFLHPYAAATMRFTEPSFERTAVSCGYTIITDIDILHYRESVLPHVQHCRMMEQHGLECYDNYVMDENRCPGIHFVTREWWERTKAARSEQQAVLIKMHQHGVEGLKAGYDERALLQIIRASGLPEPPHLISPVSCHGIHIGKWRKARKGQVVQVEPGESAAAKAFLKDREFIEIAEKIPGVIETLRRIA